MATNDHSLLRRGICLPLAACILAVSLTACGGGGGGGTNTPETGSGEVTNPIDRGSDLSVDITPTVSGTHYTGSTINIPVSFSGDEVVTWEVEAEDLSQVSGLFVSNEEDSFSFTAASSLADSGANIEFTIRATLNDDSIVTESFSVPVQATPTIQGELTGTVELGVDADVYRVLSTISVPEGSTLIIYPGTTLQFSQLADFDVHGTVDVRGTADDPVVFTSSSNDEVFVYRWPGVTLHGENSSLQSKGLKIERTETGISTTGKTHLELSGIHFSEVKNAWLPDEGLSVMFSYDITYCTFDEPADNVLRSALYVGAASTFENNVVQYNHESKAALGSQIVLDAGTLSIANNAFLGSGRVFEAAVTSITAGTLQDINLGSNYWGDGQTAAGKIYDGLDVGNRMVITIGAQLTEEPSEVGWVHAP